MKGKLMGMTLAVGAAWLALGRLHRIEPMGGGYPDAPTKVVIVGGGFGGLAVVQELARVFGGGGEVGVALIDRVNYTTFWPMVPSVIPRNVEVRHVAHSLRRIVTPLGAEFFQREVTGVDFEAKEVRTDKGNFPYDYLILAPGSRTAFFGASGAQEHAIDLKGLADALRVRNTVIDRFEEAEWLQGGFGDDLLTFVFVGGGPTGVEGAADTYDLIFGVLKDDYPKVDIGRVRLILANSGERILKGLDPTLANAAARRLAAQRVEVINNAKVEEVRPDFVRLSDGRTIPTRTTVWAAGIEPAPLVENLDVQRDDRGRILVDEYLRLKDKSGVYAVGDCARIDYDGPPIPALAQAAEQEGKRAASNLARELDGGAPVPFRYRSLGQLVDLGESSALTDILGVKISGLLGALIWKGVYLYELGYNLNRAQVLADWLISLFARPDTSKLFEEER